MRLLIFILALSFQTISTYASDHDVLHRLEKSARSKTMNSRDWVQLGELLKNISTRKIPDAEEGEDIADLLAKSFAYNWKTSDSLLKMALKDSKLLLLITKHLDSTADWNDLDAVVNQAKTACKIEFKRLCRDIETSASEASNEAKSAALAPPGWKQTPENRD